DLAGRRADDRGRDDHRQTPDRVRLRRDRRAAAGGRGRLGRDQRAALPLAEGHHGREVEAAGAPHARRARRRGRRRRRHRLTHERARSPAARGPRGHGEDRGRRVGRGEDRRVPRRAEAALSAGTLVFLEHHEGALQKGSLGVLAKAVSLGGEVAGVVLGSAVGELAATAGEFGASTVYVCDDAALEAPLPQPRVDALAQLVAETGAENVLFAASVLASDVAAGLAARLDAGLNWDLVDLVVESGELVGKRPALQDSVLVDVGWTTTPRLALVRSGTFDPEQSGGSADVRPFSAS